MSSLIEVSHLSKKYGNFEALSNISFKINKGQIIGLIGPNGAGKTTLLKTLLGLTSFQGNIDVLGMSPGKNHKQLMERMCFIADVAILPRWITVAQVLYFVENIHPKFDRIKSEQFIKKTTLKPHMKVGTMSKGMIVQLHLAIVMAIDVEILVLDEPTLGLDIIYRKRFYQSLLDDYFNENRTIIITTHQIEEIESLLTHIMMINKGRLIVNEAMESLLEHFTQLSTTPEYKDEVELLKPIASNKRLGEIIYLFEDTPKEKLSAYGNLSTPSISDIFTAKVLGDES